MKNLILILLSLVPFLSLSQSSSTKIFIKCERCDKDFFKQEMNYLNHVRDQGLADIQVFIYRNRNANNGNRYTINFIGKNEFLGKDNSLNIDTNPKMTRDEIRNSLKERIELGLVDYLIKTDLSNQIKISIGNEINNELNELNESNSDKWKNWIFQFSGDADFENETSKKESNIEFQADIDKVTDDIKIQIDFDFERSKNRYESDDDVFISKRDRKSFNTKIVWSLNDNWSSGFVAGLESNSYQNIDFEYYFMPAVEYSFYPYKEVVRREMTVNYRIGFVLRDYTQETIYGKTKENVYTHEINFETRFRQPWGDIYSRLTAFSFLQDPSKNRLEFNNWFSVRIFEGLSVRVGGEINFIRDQVGLPAGNTSIEDLLLQQKEIATNFYSELRFGISYTFGSAFNNFINSRL